MRIRWLAAKEWREVGASRATLVFALCVGPLVGHAFATAVSLYGEASGAGGGPAALARVALHRMDGSWSRGVTARGGCDPRGSAQDRGRPETALRDAAREVGRWKSGAGACRGSKARGSAPRCCWTSALRSGYLRGVEEVSGKREAGDGRPRDASTALETSRGFSASYPLPASRFPAVPLPVSRLPLPGAVGAEGAYGALVASQFDFPSTESGFEASMMVLVPTSFPSFIRPTDRTITFGVPLGRVGSL
jgi:hypothetical protein